MRRFLFSFSCNCGHRSVSPLPAADSVVVPIRRTSNHPFSARSFTFAEPAPTAASVISALESANRSYVVYKDPFYSKPADVPRRKREYAGRAFRLKGSTIQDLAPFVHHDAAGALPTETKPGTPLPRIRKVRTWEYAVQPPTRDDMQAWLQEHGESPLRLQGPHAVWLTQSPLQAAVSTRRSPASTR